jgi:uncharacterized protein YraI
LAVLLIAIPVAAAAQDAFTNRTVNVRAGPDTSYPVVAVLGAGAPVQVMGCLDDWSWCDVAFADNRGWIYAPYLTYAYQGVQVPFYTYAPSFGIPIITFSIGPYWDRYYRGRPWYARRDHWVNRPPPPHVRPPGPPPRTGPPPATRVMPTPRAAPPPPTRVVPLSPGGPGREVNRPPPSRPSVVPSSEGQRRSAPAAAPPAGARPAEAAPRQGGGGVERADRRESKGGERRGAEGRSPEEKKAQ